MSLATRLTPGIGLTAMFRTIADRFLSSLPGKKAAVADLGEIKALLHGVDDRLRAIEAQNDTQGNAIHSLGAAMDKGFVALMQNHEDHREELAKVDRRISTEAQALHVKLDQICEA